MIATSNFTQVKTKTSEIDPDRGNASGRAGTDTPDGLVQQK